jgi:hypothetical protein
LSLSYQYAKKTKKEVILVAVNMYLLFKIILQIE